MAEKPIYLVVTPFFPSPTTWRGAYCYDFVKALQKTGRYEVKVFVPGKGEDYIYQGVQVYRFPVKDLPSGLLPGLFAKRNTRAFLNKMRAVGINPESVAICHAHTCFFGSYALALKAQSPHCLTLLHHHDLQSVGTTGGRFYRFWLQRLWCYFVARSIHERMDGHVFISGAVERSFRAFPETRWSLYPRYRKGGQGLRFLRPACIKQSFILHNGVDCHQFTSEGRPAPGKTFTMGAIGNFNDLKDHASLLKAVASLKNELGDWRLRLIGSGPLLESCKTLAKELGIAERVTFETEVDHTQLPDFYRSLDLFVLPSYFEGFGCVFTESWACGTPFITCEGQGMDDLILSEERNLWLCKPKNPEALAQKILHFYHHRPEQHLSGPIDIDVLVPRFLDQVEALRKDSRQRTKASQNPKTLM